MARRNSRDVFARSRRSEERSTIDLCVDFVDERDLSPLLSLGGRWNRRRKDWDEEEPKSSLQVPVHPGQLDALKFFGLWIAGYMGWKALPDMIFSALLLGGTRSGKTYLGARMAVAFAVANPGSKVWAIGENKDDGIEELEGEFDSILPATWAKKSGKKYRLANGSTITLRSGKYPHKLKRGQCDFAFLNEGQNMPHASYLRCRERTADSGGFVLVAANPPNENEIGEWIAEWASEVKAQRRGGTKVFHFHPKDNTHISQAHLKSLESEMDPRSYAIEVFGEIRAAVNAVYHAFDQVSNIDAWPELPGLDVTSKFAQRIGLGRKITHLVGLDFQRQPHMAAAVAKVCINPKDEDRPIIYYVDEVIVDLGDEYDLSDGLYDLGLDPKTTALVGDASGEFQDVDRTVGGSSFRIMREQGWSIHFPDRKKKSNPRIADRMKNDNRLFLAESGERLVMIDPRCQHLIESVKKWRRKGGIPDRRSKWAHACDSMSYLNWRAYPRKVQKISGSGYKTLKARSRRRELRNW